MRRLLVLALARYGCGSDERTVIVGQIRSGSSGDWEPVAVVVES